MPRRATSSTRARLALTLAVACSFNLVAQARQFESITVLSASSGRLLAGDFNGDGREDLMVGHPGTVGTRLWWGSDAGPVGPITIPGFTDTAAFTPFYTSPLVGGNRVSVAPDINLDGFDDAVCLYRVEPAPRHDLIVTRSNGDGTFTRTQIIQNVGDNLLALDIDRDDDDDIVCERDGSLKVFRNSNGFFQSFGFHTFPASDARLIAGRFSDSTGPDVLVGDSLFVNDGTGQFARVARPELTSIPVFGAIDLNADGYDDLLLHHGIPPFGPLSIWWARPSPYFLSTATWTPAGFVVDPAVSTPLSGPFLMEQLPTPPGSDPAFVLSSAWLSTTGSIGGAQCTVARVTSGSLVFDEPRYASAGGTESIAVVDFFGDGCSELTVSANPFASGFFSTGFSGLHMLSSHCESHPSLNGGSTAGTSVFFGGVELAGLLSSDIDSDGQPDLIVNRTSDAWAGANTNSGSNRQLFFRNHGGTFDLIRPLYFIGSDTPFQRIELHDLDTDGQPEAWGVNTQSLVRLALRPIADAGPAADPRFWDQSFALAAATAPVLVAPVPFTNYSSQSYRAPNGGRMAFDADGNGHNDLVWFQNYRLYPDTAQPSRIVVQRLNGSEVRSITPIRLAAVTPIDFDADGDIDLFGVERTTAGPTPTCECYPAPPPTSCICLPPAKLWAFLNTGAGEFTALDTGVLSSPFADDHWPVFRIADVNADSWNDILLFSNTSGTVQVFLNFPTGLSLSPIVSTVPWGMLNPALADVDRDGDIDILAAHDPSRTARPRLTTFLNNGSASFSIDEDFAPYAPTAPSFPALADFDNDKDPDLAFVHSRGLVTLSNNLTPPACSADFNNNGTVDTPDLTYFLGRFGTTPTPGTPPARADFNNSGTVDTADLTFFLGRFSQTCPR
ncbi:MAG: FG-GAP-like repeat-containing protein [Phycisphaerales bacterium]